MNVIFLCAVATALIAGGTCNSQPDDAAVLLALHGDALQAHLESDVEWLLRDESEDYLLASRGEISRPTKEQRREQLGPYLEATRFELYEDDVEPVVRVSADGTLGWVMAQVHARGVQTTPSGEERTIEFTSAWIELYEKREGRWWRTGNVSNFKPASR